MHAYYLLLILLLFVTIPPSLSNLENGFLHKTCSNLFNCGMLTGVDFPFWGQDRSSDCGHPQLELKCINNVPMIDIMDIRYHVLDIKNTTRVLKIAREDYFGGICTSKFVNTTMDPVLFDYAPGSTNLTILYGCPLFSKIGFNILNCDMDGVPFSDEGVHVMAGVHGPENCKTSVIVPVIGIDWLQSANYTGLGQVLMNDGFEVVWKMDDNACSECISSGGRCGYDPHLNKSTCFCPYQILGAETCFSSPPQAEATPVVEAPPPRRGYQRHRFHEYSNCSTSYKCGNIDITYPFYGAENRPDYCGYPGFQVSCVSDVLRIDISSLTYRVREIDNSTKMVTVARDDYWGDYCVTHLFNTTLDGSNNIFKLGSTSQNQLSLYYNCPTAAAGLPAGILNQYSCNINATTKTGYFSANNDIGGAAVLMCNDSVKLPVFQNAFETLRNTPNLDNLKATIDGGFGLDWTANNNECDACDKSGGQCGRDLTSGQFICYCADKAYPSTCTAGQTSSDKKSSKNNIPLIVGLAAAGATVLVCLGLLMFCIIRRKKRTAAETKSKSLATPPSSNGLPTPSTNFSRTTPSYPSSLSTHDLEKGSMYFGVQVFTYTELEEATDNFDASRELGDGGFGVVYYGKLHDGRVVAVKRLYENNFKRVEQFINEIEILARLRHRNLVTLYGCTSRKSRGLLLVYEYIPNGTVADHLHGNKSKSGLLTWKVRLNIAIETASALYYLHKSDIIHRDVKTNNILLDNDFTVKVADFGLIRLFPTDMTHVSTAPQGTPGYVDPEYYQCYQLTDKSDVYSFGVVLVELISSLQAVDTNRHRHDINLSNLAINKIQNHTLHELVDPSLGYETNEDVRRMTTLVAELAFRCLQQDRDMRPSMEEVLASLKLIQNEKSSDTLKPEEVDIPADDVGLLKSMPPPFSPDSGRSFNWANTPTTTSSF